MRAQKVISKLLNSTKSSRIILAIVISTIGFSVGFYQYMDSTMNSKAFFLDSSLHACPPWPD
jgi:hypothetical protein